MTVQELIDRLAELDPSATVLLAHQPSWPLQYELRGVASSEDIATESTCDDHTAYGCPVCEVASVVYLVEGNHPRHPYAPRAAWEVAQ